MSDGGALFLPCIVQVTLDLREFDLHVFYIMQAKKYHN